MLEACIVIVICVIALIGPAILAVWFFGLRPFVAKHGRPRITAANWFLSMWADWTTACDIGKETGTRAWSTRIFLGLWLLCAGALASIFIVRIVQ